MIKKRVKINLIFHCIIIGYLMNQNYYKQNIFFAIGNSRRYTGLNGRIAAYQHIYSEYTLNKNLE